MLCSLHIIFRHWSFFFFFWPKQNSDAKDKTWETYWSNSGGILLTTANNRTSSLCGTYRVNQYQHIPTGQHNRIHGLQCRPALIHKRNQERQPLFSHFFLLLFGSFPLPIYGMMDLSGLLFLLCQVRLLIWSNLLAYQTLLKVHFLYMQPSFLQKRFPDRLHSPLKTCFISSCLLCEVKANKAAGCRENETHPI